QGSHGVVAPRVPGGPRARAAGESAGVGDAVVGYADSVVTYASSLPGDGLGVTEQPRHRGLLRALRYTYVFTFGHRSLPSPVSAGRREGRGVSTVDYA